MNSISFRTSKIGAQFITKVVIVLQFLNYLNKQTIILVMASMLPMERTLRAAMQVAMAAVVSMPGAIPPFSGAPQRVTEMVEC